MLDALNETNLVVVAKCLFVAALFGAFGGAFQKVEPVVTVPVTRVIDVDGKTYEVGYDITATQGEGADWSAPRVRMQGQPRFSVWGYQVQGPKVDIDVPQPLRSKTLFLPKLG
jgi:hypothetical protein